MTVIRDALIDKGEFEPRITRLKERLAHLETQARAEAQATAQERELRLVIGQLADFATTVQDRLDHLEWETRQAILRALVKRVEIDHEQIQVVFRVKPGPILPDPRPPLSQDCEGRDRTLIVDLETHRVLELLPDRTVATVAAWLKARPWIVLISRDRGADYAAAAREGAPQAIQVADRWHLLHNLSEAIVLILARYRPQIRKASQALAPAEGVREVPPPPEPDLPADLSLGDLPVPVPYGRPYRTAALQRAEQARRTQRLDRYEQMLALRATQVPIAEIAKQVGIDARTVRRWVAQGSFPERRGRRRRPSLIDPYEAYVVARWSAGCQNGMQLWEELRAKGYQGSIRALYHYLFRLRDPATPATQPPQNRQRRTKPRKAAPVPGPYDQFFAKHAVWLFVRPPEELKAAEQAELTFLCQVQMGMDLAYQLTQEFFTMLKQHQAERLQDWIKRARSSHIPELVTFGRGLTQDEAAVRASIVLPYSQGVVEGHVNRPKLIKRTMYGRASFPLLRQRVLHYA